jgi:hypothetical protein
LGILKEDEDLAMPTTGSLPRRPYPFLRSCLNLDNTLDAEIFTAQDVPRSRAWDRHWVLTFPIVIPSVQAKDVRDNFTVSFVFIRGCPGYIHSGISQEFK